MFVDQRGERGQYIDLEIGDVGNDRFDRLQRGPTNEDAELTEERLLVGIEQVVAPGDGVADGLLAGRKIAGAAGKQGKAWFQVTQQHIRRKVSGAYSGQLDSERQSFQAAANLDHRRG